MSEYVEVFTSKGRDVVVLAGERLTIGAAITNDVAFPEDETMSSMHGVLVRYPAGWSVRDLNSTNGTFVNGERILGESPLRPGDEVRMGGARLVFKSGEAGGRVTRVAEAPPDLTRREREVLVALCSPILSSDAFTEPASSTDIAARLVITEAAVRQHLMRLYDKFDLHDGDRRRHRLANEAVRRGAVSIGDLKPDRGR